ncbi:hypothetical protein MF406_07050 [Georgenia sp. TF02-10]|uniref:hypothetical protein n=1 Tax=Georgenia sp. TF02-10 TaxID=2917725 RepID=UPI001FA7914E|nr:hypothetical protein [Georgenia sp. TF02-10]UNX55973.1 hypothetical protein MF406_07050 [Georgenia sp. TF02-10]
MSAAAAPARAPRPTTHQPTTAAGARPAPGARPGGGWRPRLAVVPNPAPSRGVVPYLLLCAAVLAAALLGALLLNTQMAATAYEIHDQQVALNRLEEAEASLVAQVEEAGSPAALERRAEELGMVPAETVRHLRLADGTILGGEAE